MELKVFHGDQIVGKANVVKDGLYWRIDAVCTIEGTDVHRLWAHDETGTVRLGVLIPEDGCLRLSKKMPAGTICFTRHTVISTQEMHLPPFQGSIGDHTVEGAYLLESDSRRTLCVPYTDAPFLLMEYICFFRLEQHNGRLFWMTELDERNFPVFC